MTRLFDRIHPHLRDPEGPDRDGNFKAWCPFHPDGQGKPPHAKNLSVHPEKGFICHACGEKGSLAKLAEFFRVEKEDPRRKPKRKGDAGRIVATYDYRDETGRLLYQVVRKEYPNGAKGFHQRQPDGKDGWLSSLKDVRRVPYRLPELVAADPATRVFIVEGEKDVDNLVETGLLATTSPQGAGKWEKLDASAKDVFRDRSVTVIPDNDDAGRKHASKVANDLLELAAGVKILEIPGVPPKGDVSDWLARGGTSAELETLAEEAPLFRRARSNGNLPYEATPGGLVWYRTVRGMEVSVPLANFTATVRAEITEDDGAEERRFFEIEANLDKAKTNVTVAASQFSSMNWVAEHLGVTAILYPGNGIKDHTRAAIQFLSGKPLRRTVYGHLGWRRVGGDWVYLHAGGAVGKNGTVEEIEVSVPDALSGFCFDDPRATDLKDDLKDNLKDAVRSSLAIIELAPEAITVPLLAAVYRSVLRECDFAVHLCGPTGEGKTQLAALMQQHFGASMSAERLPASWSSTGNALEGLAFLAKDALLVVDDFAPCGSTYDMQRFHKEADRIFRAQGNRSGRTRMRSDSSLRATKYPRGLILSTGEEIPRGQSLRGRLLVLELSPGDLDWKRLTDAQSAAATGSFALSMSGFISWLAGRYDQFRGDFERRFLALREKGTNAGEHRRTPGLVANLALGFERFLEYAETIGAVTREEALALLERTWDALSNQGDAQADYQAASEPTRRFRELLSAAIASGDAHVAARDGSEPENPVGWGWRAVNLGPGEGGRIEYRPQGKRVGWIEGEDLFLEKEASYAVAQELGRREGAALTIDPRTLRKRLQEKHLLRTRDETRGTFHVRRKFEGVVRQVLHLSASVLGFEGSPQEFPMSVVGARPTSTTPGDDAISDPDASDVSSTAPGDTAEAPPRSPRARDDGEERVTLIV